MKEVRIFHGLVATEQPSAVYAIGGLGWIMEEGSDEKDFGWLDTVEMMYTRSGNWKESDIKLEEAKRFFGSASIPKSFLGC